MSDVIGGSNIGHGPTVIGGSNISEEHHHDHDSLAVPAAVLRDFAQTVGDGATTVFTVAHGLGTLDTQTSVYNPLTGLEYLPTAYTVVHNSPTVSTVTFAAAPAAGAARILVQT
jgi:hypothetical protein